MGLAASGATGLAASGATFAASGGAASASAGASTEPSVQPSMTPEELQNANKTVVSGIKSAIENNVGSLGLKHKSSISIVVNSDGSYTITPPEGISAEAVDACLSEVGVTANGKINGSVGSYTVTVTRSNNGNYKCDVTFTANS